MGKGELGAWASVTAAVALVAGASVSPILECKALAGHAVHWLTRTCRPAQLGATVSLSRTLLHPPLP